jgi:Protein of unknown function (DUF664)
MSMTGLAEAGRARQPEGGRPLDVGGVFVNALGRIRDLTHCAVDGLTPEMLAFRPDDSANSVAWLIWHLTRIQDDHIAGVAGTEQVWTSKGWHEHFHLPLTPIDTGYGHSAQQVSAVGAAPGDLLIAYHDAVYAQSAQFVEGLVAADLGRVVDRSWDPPVTLGVRLVSVIADDLQHVGQAAYVRGLAERAS